MTKMLPALAAGMLLAAGAVTGAAPASAADCARATGPALAAVPWPQQRLAYSRVWPLTRGAGVTVGVADSGVDASQPQLAGRVLPGMDVHTGGPADSDCVGHGTFVAGIIAARPAPGTGFAGVAPDARVLPVRESDDRGGGTASGLAAAIRAAVDGSAGVINVSVVSTSPDPALAAAVQYAAAHDVLLVAAAANDASVGNPRTYPAAYPGVLAVAAVGPDDQRSDFSETGDFIGLAAPGVDVVSIGPGGGGNVVARGTSYAAPFVAGVAALVRAYHPRLTAAQVARRLTVTADHPGARLPDPAVGWGVVNPYAAVTAVLPGEGGPIPDRPLRPVPAPAPRPAGGLPAGVVRALGVAAGCVLLALLAAGLPPTLRRGRRRGWRPGSMG